jgi:hypothetical protein
MKRKAPIFMMGASDCRKSPAYAGLFHVNMVK